MGAIQSLEKHGITGLDDDAGRVIEDGGPEVARVLRGADDALWTELLGELRGQEPVSGFADGIIPVAISGWIVQLRGQDALGRSYGVDEHTAAEDDAHQSPWRGNPAEPTHSIIMLICSAHAPILVLIIFYHRARSI